MIRLARLLLSACLVLVLSACAFGTRQPTLVYPPASEAGVATNARAAAASKSLPIVVEPFVDVRNDKSKVGTVRNGFGMPTADVVPTNNVADWFNSAVGCNKRSALHRTIAFGAISIAPYAGCKRPGGESFSAMRCTIPRYRIVSPRFLIQSSDRCYQQCNTYNKRDDGSNSEHPESLLNLSQMACVIREGTLPNVIKRDVAGMNAESEEYQDNDHANNIGPPAASWFRIEIYRFGEI